MLKLKKGSSESNSITIGTEESEATAKRKEDGKIEISIRGWIKFGKVERKEKQNYNKTRFSDYLGCVVPLLFELWLIKPIITGLNLLTIFYVFPVIFHFASLIILVICLQLLNDSKELKKNHGAEHMVMEAYEKLKRIPEVSEVKNFSRFSGACGVSVFSSLIINHLIAYLIYANTAIAIPQILVLYISIVVSSIFPFNSIGLLAQFFTTEKPDDDNIELGIAALSALEEFQQNGYKMFIFENNCEEQNNSER